MKKYLQNITFTIYTFFILFCLTTVSFDVSSVSALENDSSNLIKKISKDYTNKYCNSVAFGLSKESAMNFAIEENHKIFEERKGFKDINKELLSEKIAISVIEKCGYPINLFGNKGVEEFKNYYLSKEKELS
tara:strand:+ start:362 stop:757 length:396 start_codon:yes stop_codon:yes gene_type:complete